MKTIRIIILILCASLTSQAWAAPPAPAEPNDKEPVRARLVASVSPVALGDEFEVGVLLEIAPGWHIYWTYPGNTGKPTRVQFRSDEAHTKVLQPAFPAPAAFDGEHPDDLSFGYEKSVLITAKAMIFDAPPDGRSTVGARVSWLACKQSCVTGSARPTITLAVGDPAAPSDQAALFKQVAAQVPAPLGKQQAWLESIQHVKGHYKLRFAIPALREVETFIPSWVSGSSCKIDDFKSGRDSRGGAWVELMVHGDFCLPGVGGVVFGRLPDAAAGASALPFALQAWAPQDEQPPVEQDTAAVQTPLKPGGEQRSFWMMLLFAFLGGLLLNVMPCVIPVVVPKLLHVVRTAQKSRDPAEKKRLLWTNGLAYTAGVVITLLSLGVVIVILKMVGHEVGWGFQFQNPWFLVFMISLLLVLGLGMLHVYPLQSASHVDDLKGLRKKRRENPLLESFLTGLLVTFLGTPCTAPMLGPALGYAFTASSVQILLFLFTVGLGLAFPFLLLGAWTGWTRILPTRVSERYDRIMRGMAFLLFGTAVWLLGVLGDGYGGRAAMSVLWFLLVLSASCWIFGLITSEADAWKRRLVILLPLALIAGIFGYWILGFPADAQHKPYGLESRVGIAWQSFDEQRVAQWRSEGKTVFLDFTAEWCMNCKANERLVIETKPTKDLIDQLGVISVKADNTRHDPVIQSWLKRHGRAGVPMYLIYPACAADDKVILLPEILTAQRLQDGLRAAGASRDSCD